MNQENETLERSTERPVERDESKHLISSEKVDGTAVYATDGEKIGQIHHFMVGKRNGRVEYAVMSCGGFLGLGAEYRPVPWDALKYDTDKGGYVLGLDKARIKESPSYEPEREPLWDSSFGATVYGFYGIPY